MKFRCRIVSSAVALMFCLSILAQNTDSTQAGIADGVVWDSVHNYVLQLATVAVYKMSDSRLVSYQLSNNFGEFQFKSLPVGIPLKIVASYTGYQTLTREFTIPSDFKKIHLKNLSLERAVRELDNVVVTAIPPVRMNGDTLEFNADAFRLDSNAVVEDLMRKLPGITIWADGAITVNGRKVNSVLVDGKLFFGGDPKIAIQNLPKNAVDKIQVYQHQINEQNPLDSITDINIKLKKDKKNGLFGKTGGGYGTGQRYEADGTLNIFSPRTQVAFVAASNNINKSATDVYTLMRNASYKGVGASMDYQPEFRKQGLNQFNSGGFTFHYDFSDNSNNYDKKNGLDANYFLNNNNSKVLQNDQTITSFNGDSSFVQKSAVKSNSSDMRQNFEGKYDYVKDKRSFYFYPLFNINNNSNFSELQRSSSSSNRGLQSTSNSFNESNSHSNNMTFQTGYTQKKYAHESRLPENFQIDYTLSVAQQNGKHNNKTNFISLSDSAQNSFFDRKYNKHTRDFDQTVFLKIGDLKKMIFGHDGLAGIIIKLQNKLIVNIHNEDSEVTDFDTAKQQYDFNQYLTNTNQYTTLNEMPGLNFSKSFSKVLIKRYQKTFSIDVTAQAQYFNQKNVSQKVFQKFDRNYLKFVPNATVHYNNNQFGEYQTDYRLSYTTFVEYPTVNQLTPLTDSSNVWYLQLGNLNLSPAYKQQVIFSLQTNSFRSKNTFNYNVAIIAEKTSNAIVDSSVYDEFGKSFRYAANANEKKNLSVSGVLNKAYKFKKDQLQINFNTTVGVSESPSYVNQSLNLSNSLITHTSLHLYYSLKDWLVVNVGQNFLSYQSKQTAFNGYEFKNTTQSSNLSTSINCTPKLALSSNISYNKTTSTGSDAIHFTIWNANAIYRFFKGNNAELKFSALDLLHQNTSVINYGNDNILTRGTVNVLQQYFMLTFSYFPRKFGKKNKQSF